MTHLERQVPTLETCQQLRVAGFPQETMFYWYISPHLDTWRVSQDVYPNNKTCAAPILTELSIEIKKIELHLPPGDWERVMSSDNPAEAAALLWLKMYGEEVNHETL